MLSGARWCIRTKLDLKPGYTGVRVLRRFMDVIMIVGKGTLT